MRLLNEYLGDRVKRNAKIEPAIRSLNIIQSCDGKLVFIEEILDVQLKVQGVGFELLLPSNHGIEK